MYETSSRKEQNITCQTNLGTPSVDLSLRRSADFDDKDPQFIKKLIVWRVNFQVSLRSTVRCH